MIHLTTKIPDKIGIAFSGGVDSLALAKFLSQSHREVTLFHFWHGCSVSDAILNGCVDRAEQLGLQLRIGRIESAEVPKGTSVEDYWRRNRYKWLRSFDIPIASAHNLQDAVETWVTSSLHGRGKLIPRYSGNIFRPVLLTSKCMLTKYCNDNGLTPVEDSCNNDLSLQRNFLRAKVMPGIYQINPGLDKVIKKKYLRYEDRPECHGDGQLFGFSD